MNNNFFGAQLPADRLQRQLSAQQQQQQQQMLQHQRRQQQLRAAGGLQVGAMVMNTNHTGQAVGQDEPMSAITDSPMLDGSDSLDDIIRDNSNELNRRRSMTHPYSPHGLDQGPRRLSMMEFGTGTDGYLNFHFGNISTLQDDAMGNTFDAMGTSNMGSMTLPVSAGQFGQPSDMGMVSIPDGSEFSTLSPDMMGNMVAFSSLNMNTSTTGPDAMGMFSPANMGDAFLGNTVSMDNMTSESFSMDMLSDGMHAAAAVQAAIIQNEGDSDVTNANQSFTQPVEPPRTEEQDDLSIQTAATEAPQGAPRPAPFKPPTPAAPAFPARQDLPALQNPSRPIGPEPPSTKNVYSKSGFDMVRALYYVATRQNPQIQLGAVDMSCAFVVTDITLNDCPIIYVSSNFQNLTGYSQHEILGKNCRFLQAPDGQVEAGVKREFVEDHAVFNLKKAIAERREIQQSLINYRKGGKPFLNLLTMIPIPWDTQEIRYYVGFQIDIVECPDAIATHEMGGQMVNYKNSDIGQYIWNGPPTNSAGPPAEADPDNGQTLSADDVSALLKQFKPNGVLSDWHRQAWDKMLLENSDDVVHVLTPKGAFQYLSPSCKKVLGYDVSELVGPGSQKNTLTSICHPSDVISVTRELKDASPANPTVNIAFRIQQKKNGYAWFESYGSLFVEAGKGRKFIVLVGRKRPVFTLRKKDVEANGGIGDTELWTKLSTSGMFLFVSSNIRSLLDLQPQDLVGTSIQELMRKESRAEFGRTIEKARKGKIVSCKHEVQNRRGQVLQALTTLYPGDGSVGTNQKPAFLLAQTKLVKASSRSNASASLAGVKAAANGAASNAGETNPSASVKNGMLPPAADVKKDNAAADIPKAYTQLDDNMFEELNTTRCTSWQFELHQMEKVNRLLAEELGQLLSNRKKRKRRRSAGLVRDCANCHTRSTPEWRRGPSGQRDLCNSCGLRWAKQIGRVSPRTSSRGGNKDDAASRKSNSPSHQSPLQREFSSELAASQQNRTKDSSSSSAAAAAGTATNPSSSAGAAGVADGSGGTTLGMAPPQSQPLLAGGSGLGGSGMEMTAIREEREG